MTILIQTSGLLIGSLEKLFDKWGRFVTNNPWPVIFGSIVLTLFCSVGFIKFRTENRAEMLWIPNTSEYITNMNWLDQHFRKNNRIQLTLFHAENVLKPKRLREMFYYQKSINESEVNGKTFSDICVRIPVADNFHDKKRRKRQTLENQSIAENNLNVYEQYDSEVYPSLDYYDYSYLWTEDPTENYQGINFKKFGARNESDSDSSIDDLSPSIYCSIINTLEDKCLIRSLLEIWKYDEELILSASAKEIIDAVNLIEYSPWFGHKFDFSSLLGGIKRNSSGHIVGASSVLLSWVVNVPDDAELVKSQGAGLELERADAATLQWEQRYIDISLNVSLDGVTLYPNAAKSFSDISADAIFFDGIKMGCGYLIMFTFTMCMLGRMNRVEMRMHLAMMGILSVAMGMAIAVGISSLLGFPYTPMHSILPFLLLGIGIDDMFVIVQCWRNLNQDSEAARLPLPERIGKAMRHAGVSVTVTSLTDVFAFGVGAVTQMPGLQYFCICSAIGLGVIFLLQVSWFVAWMSLDEKRIESGRDGVLPCIVHRDYQPSTCTPRINGKALISSYAQLLPSRIYKTCIFISTALLLGFSIWGSTLIRIHFNPMLLMPSDSYLRRWVDMIAIDYPHDGWPACVFTGPLDHTQLQSMEKLTYNFIGLQQTGKYIKEADLWWIPLKKYAKEKKNYTAWQEFSYPEEFSSLLSDFLFSPQGAKYQQNFKFDGELGCNEPAPRVKATKISFIYLRFDDPDQRLSAWHAVEDVVKTAGFNETSFSYVKIYAAWETDEIIGFELWRNIGLAMFCIFGITLILLANLRICLLVFLCVVLTLVDVLGLLHFWNVTIDAISMVNIVLAVGLCVDYSVHIAHAFLISQGSLEERAIGALSSIGPAVLNGGITTFLALILLGFSTSHVFIIFFKVFLLTVFFGLFHGLIFLPVLLSLVGPPSSAKEDLALNTDQENGSCEVGSLAENNSSSSDAETDTIPQTILEDSMSSKITEASPSGSLTTSHRCETDKIKTPVTSLEVPSSPTISAQCPMISSTSTESSLAASWTTSPFRPETSSSSSETSPETASPPSTRSPPPSTRSPPPTDRSPQRKSSVPHPETIQPPY